MKTYCIIACLLLLAGGCRDREAADRSAEAPVQEATPPAPGDDATEAVDFSPAGLEADEVRAFVDRLQQAVAEDDREQVAALAAYPLTVRLQGQPTTLDGAADFVARYPEIVNEQVKTAVQGGRLADLFVNYQGVRLGRGELWFAGVYEDGEDTYQLKIIAINTP